MSARKPHTKDYLGHTLAPFAPEVWTDRGHQHIVDNCEATFAAYPLARPRKDARIVYDRGLVEEDASAVKRTRKRHLFWMEIVESRLSADLIGLVAQDVEKRVGGEEDVCFRSEIWNNARVSRRQ